MKPSHILVLNAGSSSLKFGLFKECSSSPVHTGQIEGISRAPKFLTDARSEPLHQVSSHSDALTFILDRLAKEGHPVTSLLGVGHRVVHGGQRFCSPVIVGDKTLGELSTLIPLAPHHMPHNIGAIDALRQKHPDLPQVACFDTAFHASIPEIETRLSLPLSYWQRGIRRYGFHGLNYEHIVHVLPQLLQKPLPKRLLIAHLGNGASMCAVLNGRSVNTTMGFSTLDGLLMATRSGNIDPGILLHLMRTDDCDVECLEDLLYNKSGLLGLSGVSGDMRELIEATTPETDFAIEKYCHTASQQAAALISTLEGLDAIVFTGGIGENAPRVRAQILDRLKWLGVSYDEEANKRNQNELVPVGSSVGIWIVPAHEEATIASQTYDLLSQKT